MQSKAKPSPVPAKRTQVINFAVFQQTANAIKPDARRADHASLSFKRNISPIERRALCRHPIKTPSCASHGLHSPVSLYVASVCTEVCRRRARVDSQNGATQGDDCQQREKKLFHRCLLQASMSTSRKQDAYHAHPPREIDTPASTFRC
jgi:hypothetical protein